MLQDAQRPEKRSALTGGKRLGLDTLCCDAATPLSMDQLYAGEVFEVDLITRGSGICQVWGQSIPCKQGDVLVIPPEIPHNCYAAEPGEALYISRLFLDLHDWFAPEIADAESPRFCYGVFRGGSLIAYAALNAQVYEQVTTVWQAISRETAAAGPNWQEMVRAYLAVLFITLGRYIGKAEHTPEEMGKEWHCAGVAVRMVREQLGNRELKLETIAEALHISKSHFSRLFKTFTGETFSAYLRSVRLNHACKLLRETSLTVEEIVCRCGLKDKQSFYRNFQDDVGMTPNQYRIKHSAGADRPAQSDTLLKTIAEKLQQGDGKTVAQLVQQALEAGCDPQRILNQGMLAGMSIVGEKFKNNQIFVPEVLVAVRAMNMGTQVLKPCLQASGERAKGRVCIGTVQGDLHDIGKNLVKMMMESKGLEVIDLGTDVPPERFAQVAHDQHCRVICCSALLTTTRGVMAEVVRAAEQAGIRDRVKIMIGGAPVDEAFCREIGADCYTPEAVSAAEAALAFVNDIS